MAAIATPPILLDSREAAKYLTVARQTLAKWRHLGQGPSYVRVGNRDIRYRLSALEAWLEERAVTPVDAAL